MRGQIHIHKFGYLTSQDIGDICDENDGLILMVSTKDDTQMIIGEQRVQLNKYTASLYLCREIEEMKLVSGQAVFVVLGGCLTEQDIIKEKLRKRLSFSANDTLACRICQLQAVMDLGKEPEENTLTELGFGLLLDIWTHQISDKRVPRVVSDAIAIIDNDCGCLYGVDDLADRLGVSKSHLIRRFQASMKTTPGTYLEKTRIDKAKALLISDEFDLQMVANLCGYSCANYFSKVFKKKVGVNPTAYRKKGEFIGKVKLPGNFYL